MNSSQSNIKQEEHNCIKTLVKPIESTCTKPTELADHGLSEGDHLQLGLSMNMELRQRQEGTQGSLLTAIKQNRNRGLFPSQQTTEQAEHQPVCQPTL